MASSNAASTRAHRIALRTVAGPCTWGGQRLRKAVLDQLQPGDTVRVCVQQLPPGDAATQGRVGGWNTYFRIVQIKNGTFWGTLLDLYLTSEFNPSLQEGQKFTFRRQHIVEVPICWVASRKRRRRMEAMIVEG